MQYSTEVSKAADTSPDHWVWVGFALGAAVGLLLGILLFAPARWVQSVVEQWSDGHVLLVHGEGTVWQGSAQLVLSGGPGSKDSMRLPGQVSWGVTMQSGWVGLQLHAECCTESAIILHIMPDLRGWHAKMLPSVSIWPASLLAGLGYPWNSIQLKGSLYLSTDGFELSSIDRRLAFRGALTLLAPSVHSRISGTLPIGSYRLVLQGNGDPALLLDTLEGALQLSGGGHWEDSQLYMQVQARPIADDRTDLGDLLRLMSQYKGKLSFVMPG